MPLQHSVTASLRRRPRCGGWLVPENQIGGRDYVAGELGGIDRAVLQFTSSFTDSARRSPNHQRKPQITAFLRSGVPGSRVISCSRRRGSHTTHCQSATSIVPLVVPRQSRELEDGRIQRDGDCAAFSLWFSRPSASDLGVLITVEDLRAASGKIKLHLPRGGAAVGVCRRNGAIG